MAGSFEDELADARSFVAVAAGFGGEIFGCVLAGSHATFFANQPVVWVEELMVADDERCGGTGKDLMTAVEVWSRSIGAACVSLATRRAAPFYRGLDYEDSATFFRKLNG